MANIYTSSIYLFKEKVLHVHPVRQAVSAAYKLAVAILS
jgi:hypothetical protein